MKRRTLPFFVWIPILACTSTPEKVWTHPTKSDQEFHADKSECMARSYSAVPVPPPAESDKSGFGAGFSKGLSQGSYNRTVREIYQSCMMGRGWTLAERASSEPTDKGPAPRISDLPTQKRVGAAEEQITPAIKVGAEASVAETTEMVFYSDSNAGELSTCGISFTGLDADRNYCRGSYGFQYSADKRLVPFFTVRSLASSSVSSKRGSPIDSAWLRSAEHTTEEAGWMAIEHSENFLSVGKEADPDAGIHGVGIYLDLIGGNPASVGVLHKGDSSYHIYSLKTFPPSKEAEAAACLIKMRNQSLGH